MIAAVVPGTVGRGHGSGDGRGDRTGGARTVGPMPAPPDVAVAVGGDVAVAVGGDVAVAVGGDVATTDGVHALGRLGCAPLGALGCVPAAVCVPPALPPPAPVVAPPPALALALDAPARANAAKLGSIRWATRKSLFRRPAGLADGLALKEPAPPVGSPRDSPQTNWVPRSADVGPADSASRQYTSCRSDTSARRPRPA